MHLKSRNNHYLYLTLFSYTVKILQRKTYFKVNQLFFVDSSFSAFVMKETTLDTTSMFLYFDWIYVCIYNKCCKIAMFLCSSSTEIQLHYNYTSYVFSSSMNHKLTVSGVKQQFLNLLTT